MAAGRLKWDEIGERLYTTGVKMGVLYPQNASGVYQDGVAWNGLTAVNESPSGGEVTSLYANDDKYLDLVSVETYGFTLEAYDSPDEFEACDGSKEIAPGVYAGQQNRTPFGFVFRNCIGNDTEGTDHGYELTIVYGCKAQPSSRSHSTINESPEAQTLSWEVKATPVTMPTGYKKTATIKIKTTRLDETHLDYLAKLESILYGVDEDSTATPPVTAAAARLPLPAEVIAIMTTGSYTAG